jgi:hypothetical protein
VTSIFISYAWDDDIPPPAPPGAKGFVTFLDENLRYEFKDFGPDRPQVWRDTRRVAAADQFDSVIDDALKAASTLIVILSPNWMASTYCRKELDAFARYRSVEGLNVRERVVVINKRHVELGDRPELLQGQVGFNFFERAEDEDKVSGDHEYFSRGSVQDDRFWKQLEDLANYLLRRPSPPEQPPPMGKSGRTIFVAKPASDMRSAYDRIIKELTGKGHTVVPDPAANIPLDSSAAAIIDAALKTAEISVHLLGEKAGPIPEDHTQSIVELQLARAAAKAIAADQPELSFHRIVWAPKALENVARSAEGKAANASERYPLDVLESFDHKLPTDKVEGDTLSKFVDFLNQHLVLITPPRATIDWRTDDGEDRRIYLYHSPEDTDYVLRLAEALYQRKVEIVLPAFEGPDAEVRKFHSKTLSECDAVALCWATASEVWVRAQASALRDWHGLGRTHQFAYRAVVAAPPPGKRKKAVKLLFPRSEIDVIVDLSEATMPPPELLDQLVPQARSNAA